MEEFVRGRRRWPESLPAHVGADEAGRGRLHRGQLGGNKKRDSAHGGKGANHLRRCRGVAARGRVDRSSRPGPDRRDRLRREYRYEEILRTDWCVRLSRSDVSGTDGLALHGSALTIYFGAASTTSVPPAVNAN